MKTPKCSKCGGTDIWVSFHVGQSGMKGCTYALHNYERDEHLHYGCRTCGYDWTGPTLTKASAA